MWSFGNSNGIRVGGFLLFYTVYILVEYIRTPFLRLAYNGHCVFSNRHLCLQGSLPWSVLAEWFKSHPHERSRSQESEDEVGSQE